MLHHLPPPQPSRPPAAGGSRLSDPPGDLAGQRDHQAHRPDRRHVAVTL